MEATRMGMKQKNKQEGCGEGRRRRRRTEGKQRERERTGEIREIIFMERHENITAPLAAYLPCHTCYESTGTPPLHRTPSPHLLLL